MPDRAKPLSEAPVKEAPVLDADTQLISDVARELVAQTSPEELPLFRATSVAYFQNPDKALKSRAGAEEMLGFGAELATALAPVALAVSTEVVQFLVTELKTSLSKESSSVISETLRKLFRKFRPAGQSAPEAAPALSAKQLAEIRRRAYEKARQFKLSEAQADQMADSMVATLATAPV
jgi:hypothetical protein